MSEARFFQGTRALDAVPFDDRARLYGDGLFETLRMHAGEAPWWAAHWLRLAHGAARLGIALPPEAVVRAELRGLFDGEGGVARLQLSRGPGARGYTPTETDSVWSLSRHAAPRPAAALSVRWCATRLAVQPALAGLKHCNRLEQVLARAEWRDGADEGLMLDTEGDVACATSANVLVHLDGGWATPLLDRCGVAGVCRAWIMGRVPVRETRLRPADVERADAVVLCNAVRGILPVRALGSRTWPASPQVAELRAGLAREHPAFELETE